MIVSIIRLIFFSLSLHVIVLSLMKKSRFSSFSIAFSISSTSFKSSLKRVHVTFSLRCIYNFIIFSLPFIVWSSIFVRKWHLHILTTTTKCAIFSLYLSLSLLFFLQSFFIFTMYNIVSENHLFSLHLLFLFRANILISKLINANEKKKVECFVYCFSFYQFLTINYFSNCRFFGFHVHLWSNSFLFCSSERRKQERKKKNTFKYQFEMKCGKKLVHIGFIYYKWKVKYKAKRCILNPNRIYSCHQKQATNLQFSILNFLINLLYV